MWGKSKAKAANQGSTSGGFRVRVYPEDAFPPDALPFLVTRPFAAGLIEAVVLDYPDSIRLLNRSELGDLHPTELFSNAIYTSIHEEESYVESMEYAGVPYRAIGGTHRYISSHLHALNRYVDVEATPYGALVSIPLPEYVFVHAIGRDTNVASALVVLQQVTETFFDEGERAISPQLYWWRPGADKYTQVPSGRVPELRPVGARLNPSDGFIEFFGSDTAELVQLWSADQP
ncbi:hypothetical protein ACFCV3_38535 [Kribbella sp. NPDC056345]|uniref:hypothetical protein n=1 Tax=Kribbella sp. NPDC056345 TaxID=3345789 RepID=UPI0035DC64EC